MHHYPHHIGDFDRATRHLSRLERSIYRDLIELYYLTESPISLDLDLVCRKIIARTNEERTAVEQTLNEFFTKTEQGWVNWRCEEEIESYRANASQKSIAGKASAEARRQKKLQMLNIRSTSVQQPLSSVATEFNGDPTNQEPRTINQEPLKDNANAFVETHEFQPAEPDRVPYGKILDLYHETLPEMRKVVKLTDTRKTHLRMRWKNELPDLDEWRKYFLFIRMSPFLMGMTNPGFGKSKPFQADFDFLINGTNAVKIAEGKYHG